FHQAGKEFGDFVNAVAVFWGRCHGIIESSKYQHPSSRETPINQTPNTKRVICLEVEAWCFSGCWCLEFGASFGKTSRPRPIISVIDWINSTHRFLTGLLFDNMRYQS